MCSHGYVRLSEELSHPLHPVKRKLLCFRYAVRRTDPSIQMIFNNAKNFITRVTSQRETLSNCTMGGGRSESDEIEAPLSNTDADIPEIFR